MSQHAGFIKKLERKPSKVTLDLQRVERQSKSSHNSQRRHYQLRREDIIEFQLIGIFDRKVLVTFNNRLQLFGYFDFHAIHERIRYEYYSWKIRKMEYRRSGDSIFDEEKIEKNSLITRQIYGKSIKVLIRLQIQIGHLFQAEQNKVCRWGIQIQKTMGGQIFITSYRPVLGKQFNENELRSIVQDLQSMKGECVPKLIDEWIGQFGCKGAYKFNDKLSNEEAKDLIYNLSKCEFPWNCVHGRNTIHIKSMQELQ